MMKYIHHTFSLVEMMIVIAIMALLISLMSPSLKKIVKQTHNVECKNKMTVIHRSMLLYSADEGDHYPPLYKEKDYFDPQKITWDDYLANYDGRENVSQGWLKGWGGFGLNSKIPEWDQYFCPSNPFERITPAFGGRAWAIRRDYEITRGQEFPNGLGVKSLVGVAGMGGWSAKVTEVHRPASTFLLAERIGPRFMGYPFSAGMTRPNDHYQFDITGAFIHDAEFFNYLYTDGHIEFMHYNDSITASDGSSVHYRNSAWNYQR